MVIQKIKIHEIGWKLRIYYCPKSSQSEMILEDLRELNCPLEHYRNAVILLGSQAMNVGFTYTNKEERESVIVIGRTTDIGEFINTATHEINHFIEHVMEALDIQGGDEDEAYFTGELYELLYRDAVKSVIPYL